MLFENVGWLFGSFKKRNTKVTCFFHKPACKNNYIP